jgi:exosortase J
VDSGAYFRLASFRDPEGWISGIYGQFDIGAGLMSAYPDSELCSPIVRRMPFSRGWFAAIGIVLMVAGTVTIWPSLFSLWTIWTTDALKSVGMVIPVVSLVLILRIWKILDWEAQGSWWGLAILLVAIVAAQLQRQVVLILVISPEWSTALPPPSLVLLAYGSGAVLLLGGRQLYRAALFPILLLLFANPVPHAFSLWVDLPLQQASAHIARAFAMHLGYTLTPDRLRLMFTPQFGMFIAPGCNGIRGSLTMGLLGLIAGYVYRFRWYATATVVTAAVFLGYIFNCARLCLLVLYYVVAMHYTSLQDKAEDADYVIGALLFLVATLLLFAAIHRLRDAQIPTVAQDISVVDQSTTFERRMPFARYSRIAAMAALVLLGWVGLVRASAANPSAASLSEGTVAAKLPASLGDYELVRSWNETLPTGAIIYIWGEYRSVGGGSPIAVGVSPVLGWHNPLICHSIRGDNPEWQGPLDIASQGIGSTSFSSAFYSDGVSQHIEVSTLCSASGCGEFSTGRTHFGFVYSHPKLNSLLSVHGMSAVRILFRVETLNTDLPPDVARQDLTVDLRRFISGVKLADLIQQTDH